MKEEIKKYKIIKTYPVHWGQMDAAKHVNNLIYLRWAETSRITYFQEIGIDVSFDQNGGTGPILGWQDCKYIFPVTYPDNVIVGIRTLEILKDRIVLETAVFSEKHQRIAAISKQQIIPYNYLEFRKVELPQLWIDKIKEIENDLA